jgi:hypothetical protein
VVIVIRRSVSMVIALLYLINIASAQVHESDNISVTLDHIFISKKNNSIEISEIVVFRNDGEDISYRKENHTFFAISTPPDIKNLKTEAMECCLVEMSPKMVDLYT